MTDLDYGIEIETTSGWLSLESGVYSSAADSGEERTVSYRQRTVEGDWVEGSYVVSSVRANVVETVSIYLTASTNAELRQALNALTTALEQLRYRIRVTEGNWQQTWTCLPAQYVVRTSQPLRFATMAQVSAEVPRLPTMLEVAL